VGRIVASMHWAKRCLDLAMIAFVAFYIDLAALTGRHVVGAIPTAISLDAERQAMFPGLSKLSNGNWIYTTDFRSVCATAFEGILGVDPKSFLGGWFPVQPFVLA
jgi:hypothetical protein